MSDSAGIMFRRYDGAAARELRDVVEQVYTGSYTEAIAEAASTGHPFHSPAAFMDRFDHYAAIPGFDLVVADSDGQPAGQAWGWPLASASSWWDGLLTPVEPGFTDEDGTRTFAFSEIMVREDLTGRGLAHQLHDELLRKRPEQRATLLVEPDNDTAYRAYTRWGWAKVAELRPAWPDAPLWDVLILSLPLP
jgi:ribosomal protein S18 acetylase RimI-like enzyme